MRRIGVGKFRKNLKEFVQSPEITVLCNEQTGQELAVIMNMRTFNTLANSKLDEPTETGALRTGVVETPED